MAVAANARLEEVVAEAQAGARKATERLSKGLGFVPDDKLNWSPSPTARTSLAIVAHCTLANRFFAQLLRGEPISPMPTPQQMHESMRQFETTIRDRAEAVRQLEASCEEVVAALGKMTAKRLATSADSPFGPLPMTVWMSLPGLHMGGHAAQLDYLQTIWGDLVTHA